MLFKFLIFLSFYLPFQVALNPSKGIDLASIRVLILTLFLIWLINSLKSKKIIIKNNIQTVFILSFIFLNLFSIFFARNIDWSIRKLFYLFSIFPIYFVTTAIVNDKKKMLKITKTFVFSGTLVAFLGIFQFLLQFILGIDGAYKFWAHNVVYVFLGNSFSQMVLAYPSWLVNISGHTIFRAISLFPDPHMFSFFLGLIIPISFGLWLNYKKNIWIFSFLILFIADLITFSRGGYIALLGGFIFLLFVFWNKINKKYKISLVFFFIVLFLSVLIPNPISTRFFSSFSSKDGSNLGRLEMFKTASFVIMDKTLFGVGIGNFPLEVKPLADYREPIYAHNTYLDIATEAGIIALISWVLALFFSIISFWKKLKNNFIYLYFLLSLVIFSTHSLVDNAIYSPVVLSLLLIIISFSSIDEKNENI